MPLFSLDGVSPRIDPSAFVAPTATVVGDVTIEAGASVWYGAVLRADFAPVANAARLSVIELSDDVANWSNPVRMFPASSCRRFNCSSGAAAISARSRSCSIDLASAMLALAICAGVVRVE